MSSGTIVYGIEVPYEDVCVLLKIPLTCKELSEYSIRKGIDDDIEEFVPNNTKEEIWHWIMESDFIRREFEDKRGYHIKSDDPSKGPSFSIYPGMILYSDYEKKTCCIGYVVMTEHSRVSKEDMTKIMNMPNNDDPYFYFTDYYVGCD